jgi:DNA modification methylase
LLERNKIYQGDSVKILKTFPDESISMCVTSPPYYKLREYFVDNQIGQESTPELYIEHLVDVFREVRRVLRQDGQFWLNIGDSHAGSGVHAAHHKNPGISNAAHRGGAVSTPIPQGMKPTDLMEIPSMAAIALRNDGWYLRCRIPWLKKNSMPDSAKIRPGHAVEYVFQFAKSDDSYFDMQPLRKAPKEASLARIRQKTFNDQKGGEKDYRSTTRTDRSARTTVENFANNPGRNWRDSDSFFESWRGEYDEELPIVESSVEYMFQFAKSGDSYFDHDAIRVAHTKANQEDYDARVRRGMLGWGDQSTAKHSVDTESGIQHYAKSKKGRSRDEFHHPGGRQRRDSDSFFESWQGLYQEDDELLGMVVNPKGNKYAHFAVYPEGLIEPLIKCSTSSFGYCQKCGAPFKRVIKKKTTEEKLLETDEDIEPVNETNHEDKWLKQDELGKNTYTGFNARWKKSQKKYSHKQTGLDIGQSPSSFVRDTKIEKERELHKKQAKEMYPDDEKAQKAYVKYMHDHGQTTDPNTLGWAPSCGCILIEKPINYPSRIYDLSAQRAAQLSLLNTYAQYKPARGIVLDPFMGSGTTAVVAKRFGLDYVGIDMNPVYIKDAEKRIRETKI